MKLIVTGGAGFIGSHLIKYLVKRGHDVKVVDNLRRGTINNLKEIENKIDFHQTNILETDEMENILKDADGVFHQAGLSSVPQSFKEPAEYHRVNTIGTEIIFKLAKKFGFKVVFASSSSVYGNQTKFPIKENAPKNPLNPYGESMLEAEKLTQKYVNEGLKVIGLRYFNVYGIGQNPNYAGVIPKFIENIVNRKPPIIFGDGTQERSFTFIDDVVEANLLAFESDVDFSFFNIATDFSISINKLADIMIQFSGLDLKPIYDNPRKGDIHKSQADITLAKEQIGWQPKTLLEDGIKKIFPKVK